MELSETRRAETTARALALAGAMALTFGAAACFTPIPDNIPPQAPASLAGPAFDRSPLYEGPQQADGPVTLHILHTNDMHGQVFPRKGTWINSGSPPDVGGANALAGYVTQVRQEAGESHVALFDSGDIFAGTPEGNLTRGMIMVDLMNMLGYDAMALGNHEFDQGVEVLAELGQAARFPILAANIYPKSTPEGEKVKGVVAPLTIINKGGKRIGVVGVISPQTPQMTHKDAAAAFDFDEPATAIEDAVSTLKVEGADLIVVLSHVGVDDEVKLADAAPQGVTAILGGHSHTQIDPPRRSENGVYYLQTRGKTSAIDHLIVDIDGEKVEVREAKSVPLMAADWPVHPETAEVMARYVPEIEKVMGAELGQCDKGLTRGDGRRDLISSGLGNFVTDVMRKSARADVALTNKSGTRADLDAGPVTVRDLYEVAPFDNTIVNVKLTGAQLQAVMEYAAENPRTYLEISGAQVVYDLSKPVGSRVVSIKVGTRALDPKATYTVATNSFLADGGDGHKTFTQGTAQDTGVLLRDAMAKFFEKEKACTVDMARRIDQKK